MTVDRRGFQALARAASAGSASDGAAMTIEWATDDKGYAKCDLIDGLFSIGIAQQVVVLSIVDPHGDVLGEQGAQG